MSEVEREAMEYDVVIVGAGGHGLATAYYLAKEHKITNMAVIEKGWLGGGNIGRNTTIVRSNYMLPANAYFYEHSMKLWEGLSQDLNYNVMFSQRGHMTLANSDRDPARSLMSYRRISSPAAVSSTPPSMSCGPIKTVITLGDHMEVPP